MTPEFPMILTDDVVELAAKAIEAATGYSGDIARTQARAALEAARYGELVAAAKRALNFIENTESEHDCELETGDILRALLSTIGAA